MTVHIWTRLSRRSYDVRGAENAGTLLTEQAIGWGNVYISKVICVEDTDNSMAQLR